MNTLNKLEKEADINVEVSGVMMKKCTAEFLEAVVDPFKAMGAARVPDYRKTNSICMRDFRDSFIPTIAPLANPFTCNFMLVYWSWGINDLQVNLYNADNTNNPRNNWYRLHTIFGDNDGVLYDDAGYTYNATNNNIIFGMQSSGSADYSGLAEAGRVFAGGLKVLPTIETITSSDTTAILNIWGGYLTPGDINNILNGSIGVEEIKTDKVEHTGFVTKQQRVGNLGELNAGLSVTSLARSSRVCQEFTNAQGCTVRYDPFQFEEQLEMISIDRFVGATTSFTQSTRTDHIPFPFILVEFNKTIDSSTTDAVAVPCRVLANWWLETELILPTPIYTNESPVDPKFDQIRAMAGDLQVFPPVVQGHSFKSFKSLAGKFASKLKDAAKELLPVADVVGNTYFGPEYRAMRGGLMSAYNAVKRARNRRKRMRRAARKRQAVVSRGQRMTRGRRGRGRPGTVLAGTRRPVRVNRAVPNL